MDPDVFPNSLEYWGPTGMVVLPQRPGPLDADQLRRQRRSMLALERPGASGDGGVYADRIELQNINGRFPLPDFSGAYKCGADWGYVRVAGIAPRRSSGTTCWTTASTCRAMRHGWGINLSSNLKVGKSDVVRLQFVFGEGIQNYMNDSPVDVGIVANIPGTR